METVIKKKLYEGMFLVDSAQAGSDWDGIMAGIRTILEKAGAEIVSIRKWDDRKLAYDIKGKSRGTYILCYFKADGDRIQDIEKAVQLSEHIMRVLILDAEHMKPEDIEKDTPAIRMEKEKEKKQVPKEAAQSANTKAVDSSSDEGEKQTDGTQQKPEEKVKVVDAPEVNPIAGDAEEMDKQG